MINIRYAISNEAHLLSDLAIRSKAYWGYSDEFMDACRDELSVMPLNIESIDFHYVTCEFYGRIAGYYCLKRLDDTQFELEALFVEPEYIGKGLGRELIEHAKVQAVKLGAKSINIQGDPNAEGFYLAVGAVRKGSKESESIRGRFLPLFELQLECQYGE